MPNTHTAPLPFKILPARPSLSNDQNTHTTNWTELGKRKGRLVFVAAQSTKHPHSTLTLYVVYVCVRLSVSNDHKAHNAHWPELGKKL